MSDFITSLYDLEAERALLGALILNNKAMPKVKLKIPLPSHFYDTRHALIYREMMALYDVGQPWDAIILKDKLGRQGILEQVGGVDMLMSLAESVPTTANCLYYAQIIKDAYLRREYARLHQQAASAKEQNDNEQYKKTEEDLALLATSLRDAPSLEALLQEGLDGMKKRFTFNTDGMKFGVDAIDSYTSGLIEGWLYVLGAKESHGKTAMAIQAVWRALSAGKRVIYYTFDLSARDIYCRICLHAMKKSTDVVWKSWGISTADRQEAMNGIRGMGEEIAKAYGDSLLIREYRVDRGTFRDDTIMFHPNLIVIDFLQNSLIRWQDRRFYGEQDRLTDYLGFLKSLATQHNACVLVLSQFSRAEDRVERERKPEMWMFKGGGAIEQEANVAILLDYEWKRNPARNPFEMDVKVAKVTFGASSGKYHTIRYDPSTQHFFNIEKPQLSPSKDKIWDEKEHI